MNCSLHVTALAWQLDTGKAGIFLQRCHENNNWLKFRYSLLGYKFVGFFSVTLYYLLLEQTLAHDEFWQNQWGYSEKQKLFTSHGRQSNDPSLCAEFSTVNSVSCASVLAGNQNTVAFQPKQFWQGALHRVFCGKSVGIRAISASIWQMWSQCHALLLLLFHHTLKGGCQEWKFRRWHVCNLNKK